MKKLLPVLVLSVALPSCGMFESITPKSVTKTVNDAALVLCELFGSENPEVLAGLSVSDYCGAHENLQPFIREIVAAKASLKAQVSAE